MLRVSPDVFVDIRVSYCLHMVVLSLPGKCLYDTSPCLSRSVPSTLFSIQYHASCKLSYRQRPQIHGSIGLQCVGGALPPSEGYGIFWESYVTKSD
jgi:hypothetical protein